MQDMKTAASSGDEVVYNTSRFSRLKTGRAHTTNVETCRIYNSTIIGISSYIYIYSLRERERERESHVDIHIYTYR